MSVTPITMNQLKDAVSSSASARSEVSEKSQKRQEKETVKESDGNTVHHTLNINGTTISFEIDTDLDKVVVKVMDKESGEVLREIPSEVMRDIAKTLDEAAGKLLNTVV